MLGGGFEETTDFAAAGKMLAGRAHDDDADALVRFESLEDGAQLLALRHGDDIERRPVEDHIGALAIDIDPETVKRVG
jgi:hypothetical protein